VSVGLGPIVLPDYLKRPTIVTRTSATQIDPSQTDRWGEPLDKGFARTLQENLRRQLGTDRVVLYPWYAIDRPRYQVTIDVVRFDRDGEGTAHLNARWEIRDTAANRVVHSDETVASQAPPAPEPLQASPR
jgi:uncharacterized lipoprotein YmbA